MGTTRINWQEAKNLQPSEEDLAKLRTMKDEDIDFSDIPPLTEAFWQNAMTPAQFRKSLKDKKTSEDSVY